MRETAQNKRFHDGSRANGAARVDASARHLVEGCQVPGLYGSNPGQAGANLPGAEGSRGGAGSDPVDAALALALERASAAGEWTIVATLAAELQARRSRG